ncbi:MAG: hypothetical protein JO333_06830, partial [Verrucomicrobia bacterium]|nr:hypothetical protein [Verrucomicrobiota bacterium]
MKRTLISSATAAVLFTAVTVISNSPLKGDDNDRKRDELEREVEIGFRISPVKLNLKDKDPERVGLGSYIVNAQGGCNDCHTCPSYAPKHNPFPPPF